MSLKTSDKEKIVKLALKEHVSISSLSKEYKVARKTIYSWIKTYRSASLRNKKTALENKYARGEKHPRYKSSCLEEKIIRLVKKNPTLSISGISKALKTGRHTIYSVLKALDLTTEGSRLAFCRIYAFPGILDNDIKLSVVNSALGKEKSITSLAKENHVARKTIYSWISEFKKEGKIDTDYVSGFKHPKAYSENQVEVILDAVIENPTLSIHSLAGSLNLSSHGVFNVLVRYSLTHSGERIAYASANARAEKPAFGLVSRAIKSLTSMMSPNMLPAPPPSGKESKPSKSLLKSIIPIFLASTVLTSGLVYVAGITFSGVTNIGQIIGLTFAGLALFMGSVFFLYSLKYYLSLAIVLSYSQKETNGGKKMMGKRNTGLMSWLLGDSGSSEINLGEQKAVGLEPNLDYVHIKKHPFVSVQIPFYNEKNVVRRSIEAAVNLNYPEYEVILCDDSTDETTNIIHEYQKSVLFKNEKLKVVKGDGWELTSVNVKPGVTLKHLHRTTRHGFKGAALELARTLVDPRTEFISIFDADFVPYPDSLELFLKYFKVQNGMNEDYKKSKVAAVQGYQWHVLNKSENWITRGVRSEYAGSYVIERSGIEIYGGLKQISGSVYMIRRDVLDELGWGTSITEDFELTLKLYNAGYKVLYTPYIQAPAECVSTIRRFVRQRMRWAEGHSFNVKKMFKSLMTSPKLTAPEKFEFLYLSPYYLQAFFFLMGTFAWLISETIFQVRLPFWTELWGWSLVMTNIVALPLVNTVGMFMEESKEKDYAGIGSFVALCYLVVPFQAYAAVKGFLEKEEGTWFRTPKTGRVTDVLNRSMFYRFIERILPVKQNVNLSVRPQLAIASSGNSLSNIKISKAKTKRFTKALIAILLIISTQIVYMAQMLPLSLDPKPAHAFGVIDTSSPSNVVDTNETDTSAGQTVNGVNNSDYSRGVLAINTDKAVYKAGESADISIGVLDSGGNTICDAELILKVTSPTGDIQVPEITRSGKCDGDNITDTPDYSAKYQTVEVGIYNIKLVNSSTNYSIENYFEARAEVPFSVKRSAPTRINPIEPYPVEIEITASINFDGEIKETVPADFEITGSGFETIVNKDGKTLVWDVEVTSRNTVYLNYSFDAPDSSPYISETGPLEFYRHELAGKEKIFSEERLWQIAVDGPTTPFTGTKYSFQRKTWYDGTRVWKSFNNNSRIEFWYSTDSGANWTENTSARVSANTSDFSIEADDSNLFLSYIMTDSSSDKNVHVSKASSYPGTSFSWGTFYSITASAANKDLGYVSISRDTNNKVWLSWRDHYTCFLAGTKITLADGSTKNIEDIVTGDKVLGFDPNTGEIMINDVLGTQKNHVDYYYELETTRGRVKVTETHPFFTGNGEYKTVSELNIGDTVYTYDSQSGVAVQDTILQKNKVGKNVDVYNFSTNNYHNYIANSYLVHNFCTGDVYYIEVAKSVNANDVSSWGTAVFVNQYVGSSTDTDPYRYSIIAPLAGGDMYATFITNGSIKGCVYDSSDSTWENSSGSTCVNGVNQDSINAGQASFILNMSVSTDTNGDLHLAYVDSSSYLQYRKYSSGSWGSSTQLYSSTSGYVTVSIDTSNDDVYVFNLTTSTAFYYRKYSSGSWGSSTDTGWDEGTNPKYITSNFRSNGMIFAEWSSGTTTDPGRNWDYIIVPENLWVAILTLPLVLYFYKYGNRKKNIG